MKEKKTFAVLRNPANKTTSWIKESASWIKEKIEKNYLRNKKCNDDYPSEHSKPIKPLDSKKSKSYIYDSEIFTHTSQKDDHHQCSIPAYESNQEKNLRFSRHKGLVAYKKLRNAKKTKGKNDEYQEPKSLNR